MTETGLTRAQFLAVGSGAALTLAAKKPKKKHHRKKPKHHRRPLERVEHIVILMQENRSFDSYFGTLPGVRGFSDPNALILPSGKSVFHQPSLISLAGEQPPWRLDSQHASPCSVAVDNAWGASHAAYNDGKMDGWLSSVDYLPWPMSYYDRRDVPWHMALADEFTVCDAYHASVLGPTNPNRCVQWTGWIDPRGTGGGPALDNSGTSYSWTTYPERLQAAGITWRVYHEEDDFDDNELKFFKQYQAAKPGSPLYENAIRNRPVGAFGDDVASGRLPQVSWLVAPTPESEHPGNSAARGADWCNAILGHLFAHEKVWAKTALIFTYDEPGGYFDHVPPPIPPPGTADEYVGGLPIGLGFRVPAVVCSPWTRGGYVCSQTFDHTSLLRMTEVRFGVREPQISAWRRRTCGDMWACFDFSRKADLTIPELPKTAARAKEADGLCRSGATALPPLINGPLPTQEPGTKPRRGGR